MSRTWKRSLQTRTLRSERSSARVRLRNVSVASREAWSWFASGSPIVPTLGWSSILQLQPQAQAVGPERGAVEQRRRAVGADPVAAELLRQVDRAIDLVAGAHHAAPVQVVISHDH